MYVAKPLLCWIFILCCCRGTEAKTKIPSAKTKISVQNRVRMALTGENLDFNVSVTIPANYTNKKLECYNQRKEIVLKKELEGEMLQSTEVVVAKIKMHNSSFSGNYYCHYANQEVHWVVLVRDKGYQEPNDILDNEIILQMSFSGILFIFSVFGSLYILKCYKEQLPSKDKRNEVTEKRPEENDMTMDENAESSSLYTALQHRTLSIYDMLNPGIMTHTEHKQEKNCKAQEDEDVYANV